VLHTIFDTAARFTMTIGFTDILAYFTLSLLSFIELYNDWLLYIIPYNLILALIRIFELACRLFHYDDDFAYHAYLLKYLKYVLPLYVFFTIHTYFHLFYHFHKYCYIILSTSVSRTTSLGLMMSPHCTKASQLLFTLLREPISYYSLLHAKHALLLSHYWLRRLRRLASRHFQQLSFLVVLAAGFHAAGRHYFGLSIISADKFHYSLSDSSPRPIGTLVISLHSRTATPWRFLLLNDIFIFDTITFLMFRHFSMPLLIFRYCFLVNIHRCFFEAQHFWCHAEGKHWGWRFLVISTITITTTVSRF
jgi:hypothetical protein